MLLVVVPLGTGCATHAPIPTHGQHSYQPTQSSVSSRTLYPSLFADMMSPTRFGDEDGREMLEQPVRLDDDTTIVRLDRPLSSRTIALLDDGGVALQSSTNTDQGVTLRFDPPLPIAPATLQGGTLFESETGVEEIDPRTGKTQRAGSARYRLELIGESTEADSLEYLIRSTLEIRLGRSIVLRTTDRTYLELPSGEFRLSGESTAQVVRAFGMTVSRSDDAWIVRTD